MSLPWLRLYAEFATDPKIQILAFEDQRHYVMLLCLKGNGTLDSECPSAEFRERIIAKSLGLASTEASAAKKRLGDVGLIDADWQPAAWHKRQFDSDSSTARTRRWREKQRSDVPVTSPERHRSDQIRTEQIRKSSGPPKGEVSEEERKKNLERLRAILPTMTAGTEINVNEDIPF